MMAEELKVIADFYDFMLWMIKHTEKFPRHHRYSLGLAIENRLQSILGLLLRAKYTRDKAPILSEANMELEALRFQIRLAKDLKVLPVKSHGHAAGLMQSIGSQIGGWAKRKA
ncbi:MAG TPA: diversity-generating retroelement protein Avd [Phycisphaerales bacterium]|nr:diversity-generating retroelement protein Avd [Phycisphaerales bacterium]